QPVLVVETDRRPRVRDDGRRLDGPVGDDHRAVGVAAPHGAAVDAQGAHVAAIEDGRPCDHLRSQLDALPADAGDHHLTFDCTRAYWPLLRAVAGSISEMAPASGSPAEPGA